jgi:hypothetical protein
MHYLLNKLYITDYCLWLQSALTDAQLRTVATAFNDAKRRFEQSECNGKYLVNLFLPELESWAVKQLSCNSDGECLPAIPDELRLPRVASDGKESTSESEKDQQEMHEFLKRCYPEMYSNMQENIIDVSNISCDGDKEIQSDEKRSTKEDDESSFVMKELKTVYYKKGER